MILYKEVAVNINGKWTSTKCIYLNKKVSTRASNSWLLSFLTGHDSTQNPSVGKALPKLESTRLELILVF
jgi:hypothetical protein